MNDNRRTPLEVARSYEGEREVEGEESNSLIVNWLRDAGANEDTLEDGDEALWCGAFVHACCSEAGVDLSNAQGLVPVRARSWLMAGTAVDLQSATPGNDIAVFNRGGPSNPKRRGRGHVGFFLSHDDNFVYVLGGNQSNSVSVDGYPRKDLFGIRRV